MQTANSRRTQESLPKGSQARDLHVVVLYDTSPMYFCARSHEPRDELERQSDSPDHDTTRYAAVAVTVPDGWYTKAV